MLPRGWAPSGGAAGASGEHGPYGGQDQPRNADVPGSMALPKKLLDVFIANGGELVTQFEVDKILIDKGRATGVSGKNLADNSKHLLEAPIVVGDLKMWEYFLVEGGAEWSLGAWEDHF